MIEQSGLSESWLPLDRAALVNQSLVEWLQRSEVHSKLLPHICSLVEADGQSLPEQLSYDLKQSRMGTVLHTLRLKAETEQLLGVLSLEQIPVIPMKGSALAERLYGGLDQRPFGDIDLLVQAKDIDRAAAILLGQGYVDVSSNPDQFHLEFERNTKAGYELRVELHRRLLGYAIGGDHLIFGLAGSKGYSESVWSRASLDRGRWTMQPTDELIYLCLHLAKHLISESRLYSDGAVCSSLLLARDINLALDQWRSKIDWVAFFGRVNQYHLDQPIRMALVFTRTWFVDGCEELEECTSSFPEWRRRRYLEWVRDPGLPANEPIPGPHELQMVVDAFLMSDRWSDRIQILPLVVGEFFRRKVLRR